MLEQLARDELADLARADDDRVLGIAGVPPADRAGDEAEQRDDSDRAGPEEQQPIHVRVRHVGQPREDEQSHEPTVTRSEDADQVVGSRSVDLLLVAVVEAVELGRDHPEREAENEDDRLAERAERVGAVVILCPGDERREGEGDGQAEQIGHEQRAAGDPASSSGLRGWFSCRLRGRLVLASEPLPHRSRQPTRLAVHDAHDQSSDSSAAGRPSLGRACCSSRTYS